MDLLVNVSFEFRAKIGSIFNFFSYKTDKCSVASGHD